MDTKQQVTVITATTAVLSDVLSTFIVAATTKDFVVKDNFIIDTSENAEVKISTINNNFINWFFPKTEKPFSGSTILGRKLQKDLVDNLIFAELGGQKKAEATLYELFVMMKCKDGNWRLANYGRANIFYIPDINGILRVVLVYWGGNGWIVLAYSVGCSVAQRTGFHVFYRDLLVA